MSELLTGIGELLTNDPERPKITDAAVVIEGETIAWVGEAANAPAADRRSMLQGRAMLPGWVDSHSHLVFAGDRSAEFEARMAGESYAAGGIGVTTSATRAADDGTLAALVGDRVHDATAGGTTYLETKTGYGLTVADEERSARIGSAVVDEVTYLGAHLVPRGPDGEPMDADAYVDLVCGPMLDAVRPYVRWADVFCEEGAFTSEQSRRVLTACRDAGLGLRVHGNQLGPGPGVRLACELGAASVDHCTFLSDADVDALVDHADTTTATLLPGVEFSTRSPYPDARRLLDAGVSVAIASDCNPGTCFSNSMPFMIAVAVREMGLTTAEAIVAATRGGARALWRDNIGRITSGALAHLAVLDAPTHDHLAYRPGVPIASLWGP